MNLSTLKIICILWGIFYGILPWIVCIVRVFWGNEIIRMGNEPKERRIQAEIIDFTVPYRLEHPGGRNIFFNFMYREENYYYSVITYRYRETEHTGNIYRCKEDYIGRTVNIDIMKDGRICRSSSVKESPYLTDWYWGVFIFLPIVAVLSFVAGNWISMEP